MKRARRAANFIEGARGLTLGIDSSVWLHAMAYRHAPAVVLNNDFTAVVVSFIQRAEWLLRCGMFVFDGAGSGKGRYHQRRGQCGALRQWRMRRSRLRLTLSRAPLT